MIKLFTVNGFRNFNKDYTIDLSNPRSYSFNKDCINNSIVEKSIIYGRNSRGKSNFGLAMFDITNHLVDKNVGPTLYDNYINDCSVDANFKYIFEFDGVDLEYSYTKKTRKKLLAEKLVINNELIFDCNYSNEELIDTGLKMKFPNLQYIFNDDISLLKYLLNNSIINEEDILYKFHTFIKNMLWFRTLDENRYVGCKTSVDDYFNFLNNKEYLIEFTKLLHSVGIEEELVMKEDNEGNDRLYFKKEKYLLFHSVASSGTKSLYNFFYWLKTSNSTFIFIDEFDAFYNFELSQKVVETILKKKNTQVILTTHNTNLLTNKIMRPDCYFIITKDKIVSLVDATQRELREGHNLEKLYISGEFNEQN